MGKFNSEKFYIECGALREISILQHILRGSDVWLLRQKEVEQFREMLRGLSTELHASVSEQSDAVDNGLEAIGRYVEPK